MNKLTRIGIIFLPILAVGYLSQSLIFSPVSSSERKYPVIVAQGGTVGRFCNLNNQNGGWWIRWTTDLSQDLCGFMLNNDCSDGRCRVVNQGTYSLNGRNRVEVNCQGTRGSFEGNGDQPLRAAFDAAANRNVGYCTFQVNSSIASNPSAQDRKPPIQNSSSNQGTTNASAIPLFQKPFANDFPTSNLFDHDVPQQFRDNNGYVVTWQGNRKRSGTVGASVDGHEGYDWLMPEGTPLFAVADGVVSFAGEGQPFRCPTLGNRIVTGLYLYIIHTAPNGDRFQSEYVHLSRIGVQNGQTVRAGQLIGLSGNTGCSTGPHLHFDVRRLTNTNNGQPTLIDPYGWSGNYPDPWAQNPNGANSVMLWKRGQAPRLFSP